MIETLSEQRVFVLGIIQEYLDRNRFLDMEKVISYIKYLNSKKKLALNESGIRLIIKNLLENKNIVQGSKLSRNVLLKNKNRREIYDLIKKEPGIYFNRLVKLLNFTNHMVAWHINILLKFGCIVKKKIDNHEVYFISTFKSSNYKRSYILSKIKSKKIISFFKDSYDEGITKTQISEELGLHYNTITKYFNEMEEIGILESKKFDNKTIYFLKDMN